MQANSKRWFNTTYPSCSAGNDTRSLASKFCAWPPLPPAPPPPPTSPSQPPDYSSGLAPYDFWFFPIIKKKKEKKKVGRVLIFPRSGPRKSSKLKRHALSSSDDCQNAFYLGADDWNCVCEAGKSKWKSNQCFILCLFTAR